jgi:hypothetical protein
VTIAHTFRKALRDIAAKKGDFTLFALLKRANGIGRWDLVVSAPWLDGRLETTRKLVDLVVKSIGRKSLLELGGVETVFAHDPTVKFIIKNFPVDDGERRLDRPTELFGLEMSEGIILRAKPPERKKPARKAPLPTAAAASARARR